MMGITRVILLIITLIIIFFIKFIKIIKFKNKYNFQENDLIRGTNNLIVELPKNKNDIIKIISFANLNNYKITVVSGGHSYFFMRDFPKFSIDKLIIIKMTNFKNIKYIEKKNRIYLGAGVTSGEIKKFNKKLKGCYCVHGDCDEVGMGFFLNGGTISGLNFGTSINGFASDYIRVINYINSKGEFKSLNNIKSEEFMALRMIAGEFGIVVSIEVELIKGIKPQCRWYSVKADKNKIHSIIKDLYIVDKLNNNYMNFELAIPAIENRIYIICWFIPDRKGHRSKNIKKILKEKMGLEINKLETFFYQLKNIILDNDLSDGYKTAFNNRWLASCNIIPFNEANYNLVKEIININMEYNYNMSFLWISKMIKNNFIYIEFNTGDLNDQRIKKIENKMSYVEDRIKYLNIPSQCTNIKYYFNKESPLSFDQLLEYKNKLDPNNIFITRNPLKK
jgi:hypothetical protein